MFILQTPPIQPINVTVQQPPGWPEWARTLLSALTGAVFAVLVTFVTDWIKRRNLKREIYEQITEELMDNLTIAEIGNKRLNDAADAPEQEQLHVCVWAEALARQINSDRFDYYFAEHKSLVYEIDKKKQANSFYAAMENGLLDKTRFSELAADYLMAYAIGIKYLEDRKLEFIRRRDLFSQFLKPATDDKGEEPGIKGVNEPALSDIGRHCPTEPVTFASSRNKQGNWLLFGDDGSMSVQLPLWGLGTYEAEIKPRSYVPLRFSEAGD